jgi:hypothetical protein
MTNKIKSSKHTNQQLVDTGKAVWISVDTHVSGSLDSAV